MDRASSVIALLEAQRPLRELQERLASFPWDSEDDLASLSPRHLRGILTKFLEGTLSSTEVEAWANAVEGREDVAIPPCLVQDALHELANPQLTQALTPVRAQHWLSELEHEV
jgi:hypothetical protein